MDRLGAMVRSVRSWILSVEPPGENRYEDWTKTKKKKKES